MPVLRSVGSRMVPPGENQSVFFCLAEHLQGYPVLCATAWFRLSSFPRICARKPRLAVNRPSRTRGVRPPVLLPIDKLPWSFLLKGPSSLLRAF